MVWPNLAALIVPYLCMSNGSRVVVVVVVVAVVDVDDGLTAFTKYIVL